MRIATWNVNGLRARLEFLVLWLRERRPDLVGLQELKLTEEQFPHSLLETEGYRAVVHGQKAWNGVAILSRHPVTVTQKGLPGQEEFGARLITADAGGLSFTTIYCPNGKDVGHPDFPRKLAWLETLATHLRSLHRQDRAAVVCGDFNICPAPIDSWNEERLRGTIRRGARPLRGDSRGRAPRPVPPVPSRSALVLLVGLPGRGLPAQSGSAARPSSGDTGHRGAPAIRRDRS